MIEKSLNISILILLSCAGVFPLLAQTTDLLFSEYVEGSSNNKAFEVYNGTGTAVDLAGYRVELYSNGNTAPNATRDLDTIMETLADGATLVIAHGSASSEILNRADATSTVANFNGDDAVGLRRDGILIDVIGIIGEQRVWGGGDTTTQNHTLRRRDTVCSGDPSGFDNPDDITDEWVGFPQNTFDGLGAHSVDCPVVSPPPVIFCNSPLDTTTGVTATHTVTASDPDDNIVSITRDSVTPSPAPGTITAGSLIGNSVIVTVSDLVPAGVYAVEMTATNDHAPQQQTASCTLIVNVVDAPPPPPPPPTEGWIINEYHADPANSAAGDANGDGVRDAGDDEFVELVNATGADRDLSGWTLSDANGVVHIFPEGTVVADNSAVVVFGGGAPSGAFGGAMVRTASTGALSLNNDGDTITLASGAIAAAEVVYTGAGGRGQSLTRDPDLTGLFLSHSGRPCAGGALYSPGTQIDGTPFGLAPSCDPTTSLFFSEYVEGSSINKAFEIFNATGMTADLSEYMVELYSNGSPEPTSSLSLSAAGDLDAADVLVVANPSADAELAALADMDSTVANFNGDDALVLKHDGVIIDVIGIIGEDPGSEWGEGNTTTLNHTIRRRIFVCEGLPEGFPDPVNIEEEWEGFPIDTFDGLGRHTGCSIAAPLELSCGGDLSVIVGNSAVKQVTAEKEDGFVAEISIIEIEPEPVTGFISADPMVADPSGATFTVDITVSEDVPVGGYRVTVRARSNEVPEQVVTCAFTVNVTPDLPGTLIHVIQGDQAASPHEGDLVLTEGNIVTAVTSNGFFIQAPEEFFDEDPLTSEGIFVFTNDPPDVAPGDEVNVTGTVAEFHELTELSGSISIVQVSTDNPLPDPMLLEPGFPGTVPRIPHDLERFEGMLVSVAGVLATGPTDGHGDIPIVNGVDRPFREPGILLGPPDQLVWDGNPELFEIDPNGAGLPHLDVFAGSRLDATGPLSFSFGKYSLLPIDPVTVIEPAPPGTVRARGVGELTVGAQNLWRLFKDQPDQAAYGDRLAKFSKTIREVLGAPDILAVSEVDSLEVLQDLATRILSDNPSTDYSAFLMEGHDVGGIDVGFLVLPTITVTGVTQILADDIFEFDGNTSFLHDRPPLLLEGSYNAGSQPFPITVMAVHNRSLNNIDDPDDGTRVRQKRFEQAEGIALFIQDLQDLDPSIHLVVTGDFNAFQFSDGYADCLGIISGNLDPAGAMLPGADLVEPDLVNQVLSVSSSDRYSFIFEGNAQVLDHLLTSAALTPLVVETQFGRGNADSPGNFAADPSTALRSSDHDGIVTFISVEGDLTDQVFPWVSNTSRFRSTLAINNLSAESVQVRLTAIREEGNIPETETVIQPIEPLGQLVMDAGELFQEMGEGRGYMVRMRSTAAGISGGYVVRGTRSPSGSSPAQANVVATDEAAPVLLFNFLSAGEDGFSSPVVLNMDDEERQVTFRAYIDGEQAAMAERTVPGLHPHAELTGDLFPGITGNMFVVVQSEGPLLGVAFIFNAQREPSMANAIPIPEVP